VKAGIIEHKPRFRCSFLNRFAVAHAQASTTSFAWGLRNRYHTQCLGGRRCEATSLRSISAAWAGVRSSGKRLN
jgi:hypothetical protein